MRKYLIIFAILGILSLSNKSLLKNNSNTDIFALELESPPMIYVNSNYYENRNSISEVATELFYSCHSDVDNCLSNPYNINGSFIGQVVLGDYRYYSSAQSFSISYDGNYIIVMIETVKKNINDENAEKIHVSNSMFILKKNSDNSYTKVKVINNLQCGHANGSTYYKDADGNDNILVANVTDIIKYKVNLSSGTILETNTYSINNDNFRINGISYDKEENVFYLSSVDRILKYDVSFTNAEIISYGDYTTNNGSGIMYKNQDGTVHGNYFYAITALNASNYTKANDMGLPSNEINELSAFENSNDRVAIITVFDKYTGNFVKYLTLSQETIEGSTNKYYWKSPQNYNASTADRMNEIEDIEFINGAPYALFQNGASFQIFAVNPEISDWSIIFHNVNNVCNFQNIENGIGDDKLFYECFGAKGDGITNDYTAIRRTHEYANNLYIEKGINVTVYAKENSSYYVGINNSGRINVITNVDFSNAVFVIDDYIEKDGQNAVKTAENLFYITSPMYIETGKNYLMAESNNAESSLSQSLLQVSRNENIGKSTNNIKQLSIALNEEINSKEEAIKKYYYDTDIWQIKIYDDGVNRYIRSGDDENDGSPQNDTFLINRNTGNILNDITWNYSNITKIIVWPVPKKSIVIENGEFITRTNNSSNVYPRNQRNFFIEYTGNITLRNITHKLDEEFHKENVDVTHNQLANSYHGFIKMYDSSYITIKDSYFTPHSTDGHSTYDILFTDSINILFDNVKYPCDNMSQENCKSEYLTNSNRWGIIGSNGCKNVFIINSKLNRIDSHMGLTNLYVYNTDVGDKGFSLTGYGTFYAKNVNVYNSSYIVKLREDYGSTWNGDIILENVTLENNLESSNLSILIANNLADHNYGYDCYIPDLYLKNINIKSSSSNNVIILKIPNRNFTSSQYKYFFKGNISSSGLVFDVNDNTNITVFRPAFSTHDYNFSMNNYNGNNVVYFYDYDNNKYSLDQSFLEGEKFKYQRIDNNQANLDEKINNAYLFFENLKNKSMLFMSTVIFDSNGGSSVPSQTVNYNEDAIKPNNPTKTGYTFKEWRLSESNNAYDFNTPVIENITLEAVWTINQYTIAFDSDGGSSVPSQTVNYNEKAIKPNNPTKAGYTFVEWRLNGNTYNFNTPITNNITLTAIWKRNETVEESLKKILQDHSYTVTSNLVTGLKVGTTVTELKNKLGNSNIQIDTSNTLIATGVVIKKGNESYTIVIKGDLTGDGKINSGDLLQMRKYLLEDVNLTGAYKEAGIIESIGNIKSLDLLRLRQYLLGEYIFK